MKRYTSRSAIRAIAALLLLAALAAPAFAQSGGILGKLREALALEIGSVTIDGRSYSKVVLTPEARIGRLKFGLYLPVIYDTDLFNPDTWYKPAGNNEWDFGGAKWSSDVPGALADAAQDLVLKIKYVEYGEQLKDKFFFKVGNLKGLTIGHGLIMRDYRNDTEFPAVRRTGLNIGYDFGRLGFEALVNDLPGTQVAGGRLYFRPIPKSGLALGVSGVVDMKPGLELASDTTYAWTPVVDNFMFASGALDLDMPIIPSNGILSVRAFADAGATLPWIREGFASPVNTAPIASGLQTDFILGSGLTNWGAATGLMGNVTFIDWRLEYRYQTGIFRPAFYDAIYDRQRAAYVKDYLSYLDGRNSFAGMGNTMGVYGEAGFNLFGEKLALVAGYLWPWSAGAASPLSDDDELHARLVVKKGLIPVLDLSGAIGYDKRNLVSSISAGTFRFFDADSVFYGELIAPVPGSPNIAIAAVFQTVPERDAAGAVKYDAVTGQPVIYPAVSIETRLRF